ncbi:MAG: nfrA [Marmoricola sp.]|nr:nfrA [Marmoricola sp.]
MDFQNVVDRRRMVRSYTEQPVDPALVDRALRNATHAPSAGFSQGWGFLVLDTPDDVRRWWATTVEPTALAAPDRWLSGMMRAPVVVVPCSNRSAYVRRYAEGDKQASPRLAAQPEERWSVPYWHMDAAMASLLILQTVVDEGLGACFFGIPLEKLDEVRDEFGIDTAFEPVGAITIGHRATGGTAGSAARRDRRPVHEVVHRGSWT